MCTALSAVFGKGFVFDLNANLKRAAFLARKAVAVHKKTP
jgi:hypothetical protein